MALTYLINFLSYYRSSVKTKKWPHAVYFHMHICSVINAGIVYKTVHNLDKHHRLGNVKGWMEMYIDHLLGKTVGQRAAADEVVGAVSADYIAPKHVTKVAVGPSDVRYMGSHWPVKVDSTRAVCKNLYCGAKVSTFCDKCGVALCVRGPNGRFCFKEYHTMRPQDSKEG